MIVLKSTLCAGNNFRKVGLIQSCINLAIQILCLAILFKVVIEASPRKRGYYVHGHRINKTKEKTITHILIDIMFFIVIDIIAYLWLIFGLIKRKQIILTGWLLFSVMELVVLQISSFYFAVYITITSHSGASVLGLIIPILVTLYMTYNMCVIYTFRHRLIQEQDASLHLDSDRGLTNTSSTSYPQYRLPHMPYVPSDRHVCDLHGMGTSDNKTTFVASPPPYVECIA